MSSIEKDLTMKNIEQSKTSPELLKRQEYERKFLALDRSSINDYHDLARSIEQTYLSHPADEFSLRVRAEYHENEVRYTATLKDRGEIIDGQLARLEVETPISADTYRYYTEQSHLPTLHKLRAEIAPGVTVDYIEGLESALIEVEQNAQHSDMVTSLPLDQLHEVTSDGRYQNESLAHALHGSEQERSLESLDDFTQRVTGDIIALYSQGYEQVVTGVSGMSGSGKTSAVQEVARQLETLLGPEYAPIIVSTDDYHRGRHYLEETYGAPWKNWDDPRVYNTNLLAADLERLAQGNPLQKRHFDFSTEESVLDEVVAPRPFVLVEGIYAGSPDLDEVRQLHFEVPTSPATSIGRDIRRLVLENRMNSSIGSPEDRLRYQLETALPTYQEQKRPRRNAYPAYCRPLAERAFMLQKLTQLQQDR